jgi:hypothetical protein
MTSSPSLPVAETPERQAHGKAYNPEGDLLYLLGDDFIQHFKLETYRPYLVRPRFIRAGQSWPALNMPLMGASKLQVRCQPETPAHVLEEIGRRLNEALPSLKLGEPPEITIETKACCFSPCFGCLVHQGEKAPTGEAQAS